MIENSLRVLRSYDPHPAVKWPGFCVRTIVANQITFRELAISPSFDYHLHAALDRLPLSYHSLPALRSRDVKLPGLITRFLGLGQNLSNSNCSMLYTNCGRIVLAGEPVEVRLWKKP